MKRIFRLLGIVAVVAIIGFGVVACDDGNGGDTSCTHTWVDGDVIIAATCDTAGSQKQVCSKCGAEGTAKTLNALGHQWDEVEANWVTTAATCEVAGGTKTNCTRPNCTATEARGEAIPALGHSAPGGTPATCTTNGNTGTGTCTRTGCGQTVTGQVITAYGHTKAAEPYATTPPTCTEDGTKTYRCIRFDDCGHTYDPEKYADKLGHNISGTYQYNDTQHWQVCQNAGCTETGTKANHTSTTAVCTVCGYDPTPSIPFTYEIKHISVTGLTATWVEITGYTGADTDVTIPAEIEGYLVEVIGENAFNNKGLTSVTFPDHACSIGANAFANNLLTSLTILNNMDMGANAFANNPLTSVILGGPNYSTLSTTSSSFPGNLHNVLLYDNRYAPGTYVRDGIEDTDLWRKL